MAQIRASDADREQTVAELRRHLEAGRLSVEEFSERVGRAYAARMLPELGALMHDLPAPRVLEAGAPRPTWQLGRILGPFLLANGVAIAVWAATGADSSFWPRWVLLATGIRMAIVLVYGPRRRARRRHLEATSLPPLEPPP